MAGLVLALNRGLVSLKLVAASVTMIVPQTPTSATKENASATSDSLVIPAPMHRPIARTPVFVFSSPTDPVDRLADVCRRTTVQRMPTRTANLEDVSNRTEQHAVRIISVTRVVPVCQRPSGQEALLADVLPPRTAIQILRYALTKFVFGNITATAIVRIPVLAEPHA